MNLIIHQFKTDFRHFRWRLLILWLLFAGEPLMVVGSMVRGEAVAVVGFVSILVQALVSLAVIVPAIQSDALVGTSAAWLTRPIRRAHLFWAKSLFILLCLVLPRLALQWLGWAALGFSWSQMFCAAGQWLLFSGVFVLTVTVLASLTRTAGKFLLAVGIAVGGFFIWMVALEALEQSGVTHYSAGRIYTQSFGASFYASVTVATLMIYLTTMASAWVMQARFRQWKVAVLLGALGIAFTPLVARGWYFNFLKPRLTKSVPIHLSVWTTNTDMSLPQRQRPYLEFVVDNVPDQKVAVVQNISAQYLQRGAHHAITVPRSDEIYRYGYGRHRPMDSQQTSEWTRIVRSQFPSNTLWFSRDFRESTSMAFNPEQSGVLRTQPAGRLDGKAELDLYDVRKVAEMPLQRGSVNILPGRRVSIQQVKIVGGNISVTLDESAVSLLLDRNPDTSGGNSYRTEPNCSYVLYHAGTGEAFVVGQRYGNGSAPAFLGCEMHLWLRFEFPYPALRERFTGLTAAEWLRGARLCVFAPVYAGTCTASFKEDNYIWPYRFLADKPVDVKNIAALTLPANADAAQVDAYLDALFAGLPEYGNDEVRKVVGNKLAALGTNGLPRLLQRLPLGMRVEGNFGLMASIAKLATRDQLPELCAALERDPEVWLVFKRKRWEADALPTLKQCLHSRNRRLSDEELKWLGSVATADMVEDFRWHFTRLEYGHGEVLAAWEKCPGLDLSGLVRAAWQDAELGLVSKSQLAIAAAKLGLPGALTGAVQDLEVCNDDHRKERDTAQLAALTGYSGDTKSALAWLGANLGGFRYDPAQQRYVLP